MNIDEPFSETVRPPGYIAHEADHTYIEHIRRVREALRRSLRAGKAIADGRATVTISTIDDKETTP